MKNETFRGIVAMGDKRQPVYVPGAKQSEAENKAGELERLNLSIEQIQNSIPKQFFNSKVFHP